MKTIFMPIIFSLLWPFNSQARGGYTCYYELREFHGVAYYVLKNFSSLYPFCGEARAKNDASNRCQAHVFPNSNRVCVFLGCEEDPFLGCENQK